MVNSTYAWLGCPFRFRGCCHVLWCLADYHLADPLAALPRQGVAGFPRGRRRPGPGGGMGGVAGQPRGPAIGTPGTAYRLRAERMPRRPPAQAHLEQRQQRTADRTALAHRRVCAGRYGQPGRQRVRCPALSRPRRTAGRATWEDCLPVPPLRPGYRPQTLEFRAEHLQGSFSD